MSFLAILGALNTIWTACRNLFGLFAGKKPATTDHANDQQAQAAADAAQTRDRRDLDIEGARERSAMAAGRVRDAAVAGGPDQLQHQREEVQAAIDRANTGGGL